MTAIRTLRLSSHPLPFSTSFVRPARCTAGDTPRRGYVSPRVLEVLANTPVGRASLKAFQFQPFALCDSHSRVLTRRVVAGLATQGTVKSSALTYLRRTLGFEPTPTDSKLHLDATDVRQLIARRGPVQLVSHRGLQPGQGDDTYRGFHAVVALAAFDHGGRTIGLLLDGNDLQTNPVMSKLKSAQAKGEISGDLDDLDSDQLHALDSKWRQEGPDAPRLFQSAFRLVDLQEMLDASSAIWPAMARALPSVEAHAPLLSVAAERALGEEIDRAAVLLEHFTPAASAAAPTPMTTPAPSSGSNMEAPIIRG